jgi:hypothetical protein
MTRERSRSGKRTTGTEILRARKRWLSLAVVCLAASAWGSSDSKAPVVSNCAGHDSQRPRSFSFCGDGNFYINKITWSSWSTDGATGTGTAHQNLCKPFCAGGRFTSYRTVVRVSRPRKCSNGRTEFTRLSYQSREHPATRLMVALPVDVHIRCA